MRSGRIVLAISLVGSGLPLATGLAEPILTVAGAVIPNVKASVDPGGPAVLDLSAEQIVVGEPIVSQYRGLVRIETRQGMLWVDRSLLRFSRTSSSSNRIMSTDDIAAIRGLSGGGRAAR